MGHPTNETRVAKRDPDEFPVPQQQHAGKTLIAEANVDKSDKKVLLVGLHLEKQQVPKIPCIIEGQTTQVRQGTLTDKDILAKHKKKERCMQQSKGKDYSI
ncbi:hypothetical protein LOK49_LG11G02591 [Camellia lanceoleosa]|uniref:Uncharacterized protein n=1 Tax=Camellia lanceoleosa TaxID=1840588 RepID=A0ACC0FZM0_9ERIC|nr:hypothetical protein LOK49_LG11G02591 [Camellia lanceoleosa]